MDYDLYVFDADKTLVRPWTTELLPGVEDWFTAIAYLPENSRPGLAIATNQGGVGLRYWREYARANGYDIGDPNQSPPQEFFEETYQKLADRLEDLAGTQVSLYMCFAYQSRTSGKWGPIPPSIFVDPRWNQSWRKPNPGMLKEALGLNRYKAGRAIMVGDEKTDKEAADSAGFAFAWAHEFFGREPYDNK